MSVAQAPPAPPSNAESASEGAHAARATCAGQSEAAPTRAINAPLLLSLRNVLGPVAQTTGACLGDVL
eukprot:3278926-Alexandrium_andersonii.AAC.1